MLDVADVDVVIPGLERGEAHGGHGEGLAVALEAGQRQVDEVEDPVAVGQAGGGVRPGEDVHLQAEPAHLGGPLAQGVFELGDADQELSRVVHDRLEARPFDPGRTRR